MSKLMDFLGGIKVVEKTSSLVNGKIEVFRSFAFGTYIQVGGLTQTGGVVNDVWKTSLKKIKTPKLEVGNCLILGLGGGGNAGIVRKFWKDAKITGVDLDPKMVEMGKKYFNLDSFKVKVVISDAEVFLKAQVSGHKSYDLVLIDLYLGDKYPDKFETENFILLVKSTLNAQGAAIFNRLYYGEKRKETTRFLERLEKLFPKVDIVYPEANVMYICKSSK